MIWIVENSCSEIAVIGNMVGWQKLLSLGIDARANRFRGVSHVIAELPVSMRATGRAKAIRAAIASTQAVYPCDCRQLAIVDEAGRVLAGPGDKIALARETGTARRTVWGALTGQLPMSGWGWVVHLSVD